MVTCEYRQDVGNCPLFEGQARGDLFLSYSQQWKVHGTQGLRKTALHSPSIILRLYQRTVLLARRLIELNTELYDRINPSTLFHSTASFRCPLKQISKLVRFIVSYTIIVNKNTTDWVECANAIAVPIIQPWELLFEYPDGNMEWPRFFSSGW
jgi:hypothetical protein